MLGEMPKPLFDPLRTPKHVREELPRPAQLRTRLDSVLKRSLRAIASMRVSRLPGLPPDFLVHHVAQHELQHAEHVRVIAALCEGRLHRAAPGVHRVGAVGSRVEFGGGEVAMGNADVAYAYDNERPRHRVRLEPFWIDAAPATVREFGEFLRAGGYRKRRFWSDEGWRWRIEHAVDAPLGWIDGRHPDGALDHPVSCISWFEADAYARFRGARLPTEAEWEIARASIGHATPPGNHGCLHLGTVPVGACSATNDLCDLAGQVWEWTSSWFAPYRGFRPYPYREYSEPWFGTHRVLRGGCWATSPALCRPAFRNWYEPGFREIPAGVRCAGGTE
jgi:ergothioneine biosynthesis protein EgtB